MTLVGFTAFVGLLAAPVSVHPFVGFTAILFIALGGGASGALNMWYDADIDAVMRRTKKRPIPAGKVTADEAKAFGIALSGISVVMLGLATNWYAAGLLAFTIFFYVVIYTMWLKRWTRKTSSSVVRRAHSSDDRMVGGNGQHVYRSGVDVYIDLYVDASAFLGIGLVYAQRL